MDERECNEDNMGYFDSLETCYCEPHCSWAMCRLESPATDCLVDQRSTWKWNPEKRYYMAQKMNGVSYTLIQID